MRLSVHQKLRVVARGYRRHGREGKDGKLCCWNVSIFKCGRKTSWSFPLASCALLFSAGPW